MKNVLRCAMLFSLLVVGCGKSGSEEVDKKPSLKISPQEKLVTNSAGSFDIQVKSNAKWSVEAISEGDWLSPAVTNGTNNATVKIAYSASTTNKRMGTVRFTAEGFRPVDAIITQTEQTFTNPVADIMPDPWIVKHEGFYYLCKSVGNGINISKSSKLSKIEGTRTVWRCPANTGPSGPWNVAELWAPELHHIDGKWYVYYAAGRPQAENNSFKFQRTGVLRAKTADPMGEWEDMGMIYTGNEYQNGITATFNNTEYAIDMAPFELNGQLYAVWSGYSQTISGQQLYIATMSNPYTISSSRVLIAQPELSWELENSKVVEGPAYLRNEQAGKLFLVYSANQSTTKYYRLGYLSLDLTADPMVPVNWKKSPTQAFYRCDNIANNGVNGVGHCCFTKSPDDTEDWIVYHTKASNESGWGNRPMFMQKFIWNADGTPNFGDPVGWGQHIPIPSGESL